MEARVADQASLVFCIFSCSCCSKFSLESVIQCLQAEPVVFPKLSFSLSSKLVFVCFNRNLFSMQHPLLPYFHTFVARNTCKICQNYKRKVHTCEVGCLLYIFILGCNFRISRPTLARTWFLKAVLKPRCTNCKEFERSFQYVFVS